MQTLEMIKMQFDLFVGQILNYALLLAATGTLAMALLEAVKGVLSAKTRFHKYSLGKWLNMRITETSRVELDEIQEFIEEHFDLRLLERLSNSYEANENPTNPATADQNFRLIAVNDLESICSGVALNEATRPGLLFEIKEEQAFYSLETAQFTARVQRSLEAVLHNPERSGLLFLMLAASHPRSAIHWLNYLVASQKDKIVISPEQYQAASRHLDQLTESLNDRLDSFQVNTLYSWGRLNRFVAMLTGAALLFYILTEHFNFLSPVEAAVYSALGGMVSPVAKNLVTALRSITLK